LLPVYRKYARLEIPGAGAQGLTESGVKTSPRRSPYQNGNGASIDTFVLCRGGFA
jgi:hypothetical protein